MISRRSFIKGTFAGTAAASVVAGLFGELSRNVVTGDIRFEQVTISLSDLPNEFDGYKIGFLSDIHLGMWIPSEWIEHSLQRLAQEKIDLLVLGGDYIMLNDMPFWQLFGLTRNDDFKELRPKAAASAIYNEVVRLISQYKFPDGTVAVPGNHDHWNYSHIFEQTFRNASTLRLLINEDFDVVRGDQRLSFFGVDDYLTGLPTRPSARFTARPAGSRILISHNPDYVSNLLVADTVNPLQSSLFDVALCGHTHGGQICLPGATPVAVQVADTRFASGLFEISSVQTAYTSRGLGFVGVPFRINCPPEVSVITLQRNVARKPEQASVKTTT
jgi:predicted MPP superfamily phosphohydrolase